MSKQKPKDQMTPAEKREYRNVLIAFAAFILIVAALFWSGYRSNTPLLYLIGFVIFSAGLILFGGWEGGSGTSVDEGPCGGPGGE